MQERLQKILAHCGVASRRQCEVLIEEGRVAVNGTTVTKLGTKVDAMEDEIRVDGERVTPERKVYYLLNKPKGYICTQNDEFNRPRVVDLIPEGRRIYPVGRLDENSEGLLILTNDGRVANVVCHPRYEVDKTYRITVRGKVTREQTERIEKGVWLAEGKSAPAEVRKVDHKARSTIVTVTIWEGRNRELRRIFAKVDLKVSHLVRTAIGPLKATGVPAGAYRRLRPEELDFVWARLKPGAKGRAGHRRGRKKTPGRRR